VVESVAPLDAERGFVRDSIGRVLAQDIISPVDLPPWNNASMDGYAVRADDVRGASSAAPRLLRVIATIAAGDVATHRIGRGEAARIMTGAPVPSDTDSVVRVEDTDAGERDVRIHSDRDAGRNVRPRGEDVSAGAVALRSGVVLNAGAVGLLASVGCSVVSVHRRPRVAVLASGDELVPVEEFDRVRAGDRIVSSNSYSIEAAIVEAGGVAVTLGTIRDDPDALRDALSGLDCDLLVTTGGVSVGAFDYTRQVLKELGMELKFWRVRIRPGGPVGFGVLRGTPWLGLPGNPVSTLVTFELFARPAIRRMLGVPRPFRRLTNVRAGEAIEISAPLTHFLRARLQTTDDGMVARLTGAQGSGLLSSMAHADALLVIAPERAHIEAGETVPALVLREDVGHTTEPPF